MPEPRTAAPPGNRAGGSRIVAGVDGSASAPRAGLLAADRAARRNGRLRLVPADDEYVFSGGTAPQSFVDVIRAAGEQALGAAVRACHPTLEIDEPAAGRTPRPTDDRPTTTESRTS